MSEQGGKTLRQIAEEIGLDKSTVFRFVKSAGIAPMQHPATLQRNAAQRYDATAETAIKEHFCQIVQHPATVRNDAPATPCNADAMRRNDATQYLAILDNTLDAIRDNHRAELERIQAEHLAELDRLRAAHAEQLRQLEKLAEDLTADREQLRQELAAERQHSREQSEKLAQLADQAQRLQAQQMQQQQPAAIEDKQQKPTFWARLFRKNNK